MLTRQSFQRFLNILVRKGLGKASSLVCDRRIESIRFDEIFIQFLCAVLEILAN